MTPGRSGRSAPPTRIRSALTLILSVILIAGFSLPARMRPSIHRPSQPTLAAAAL